MILSHMEMINGPPVCFTNKGMQFISKIGEAVFHDPYNSAEFIDVPTRPRANHLGWYDGLLNWDGERFVTDSKSEIRGVFLRSPVSVAYNFTEPEDADVSPTAGLLPECSMFGPATAGKATSRVSPNSERPLPEDNWLAEPPSS